MPDVKHAIEVHWKRVFNFAFRMMLDRERARDIVEQTYIRAYIGAEKMPDDDEQLVRWLLKIAAHVVEKKAPPKPEVSWELLDETLRSEATRTDVVQSLSDPQRNFLLWELKQGCMTAVVNCLPVGERAAFVMSIIMGLSDDEAASSLGISTSAFKVRLSRARKKVNDYLAPRCEHVNPHNPCRCPSRIGVALDKGFLPPPPSAIVKIRPHFEENPQRDATAVYQTLPDPDLPEDQPIQLVRELESGAWEQYRKRPAR